MQNLLDQINSPDDLKKLKDNDLKSLAEEIRTFLIENVSKTGGHLASNLGVVELTLALHYVFSTPEDKIVWDVGHQSYIHKILTGRKDRFNTLRQLDGLSGFPKREESPHDMVDTGHSSTSISVALGLCRARDLLKQKNSVIAVIGDGAMTGGMAFEALNDAGFTDNSNFIIILNDNEMSISKNVGGMSQYLNRVRTGNLYLWLKKTTDVLLNRIPFVGHWLALAAFRLKNTIKYMMFPDTIFDELGFRYMGPYDGHDVKTLINIFNMVKTYKGPIMVHLNTKKGKGYPYAEQDPDIFHGVSEFDVETGEPCTQKTKGSYSAVFGKTLTELAQKDDKVVAISAAMIDGTGLATFAQKFPDRIFDVGIAEQHAVSFAAGLSLGGFKPVFAVYSSFLQRAYDQLLHDICLQNLHAVFAIDRAGIVGQDGETHQGIFDFSYLSHLPNMTILAPSDFEELKNMLRFSLYDHQGPMAIRYPRGGQKCKVPLSETPVSLGKGVLLKNGHDLTIVAIGNMVGVAMEVGEACQQNGISCEIINARFLKPLDANLILHSVQKTGRILTMEDNIIEGGLSSLVLQALEENKVHPTLFMKKAFPVTFVKQGKPDELFKRYRLDAQSIVEDVLKEIPVEGKNRRIIS